MFALVALSCGQYFLPDGRDHRVVTGFESKADAYAFAAALLVMYGHAESVEGGFLRSADPVEGVVSAERLVVSWADDLIGAEYFHVYEMEVV